MHLYINKLKSAKATIVALLYMPIYKLRLGYLKAVSTCCWQTVSASEVTTVQMSSVLTTILLY